MEIRLSSLLNCSVKEAWQQVMKPGLLLYISSPLIKFKPISPETFPEQWSQDKYLVQMLVFGCIPFGKQWIVITKDEKKHQLRDNGYGDVIQTWDHLISLESTKDNKTLYTDQVTIRAGVWTPFITSYALFFYWWRQKQWKKLVKNKFRVI